VRKTDERRKEKRKQRDEKKKKVSQSDFSQFFFMLSLKMLASHFGVFSPDFCIYLSTITGERTEARRD